MLVRNSRTMRMFLRVLVMAHPNNGPINCYRYVGEKMITGHTELHVGPNFATRSDPTRKSLDPTR